MLVKDIPVNISCKPFIPKHAMYVMACGGVNHRPFIFVYSHKILFQLIFCKFMEILVSLATVFRLITGEECCVTSLKTAVRETKEILKCEKKVN